MNNLYIRVYGQLIPITAVSLVQVNPNNPKKVETEETLDKPIRALMRHNLDLFKRENDHNNSNAD